MTKDKDEGVGYRDSEGEDDMGGKGEGDSQAKGRGNVKHEGGVVGEGERLGYAKGWVGNGDEGDDQKKGE